MSPPLPIHGVFRVFTEFCRDEFEAYVIYSTLSRVPFIGSYYGEVLRRFAEEEYGHYKFFEGFGGCGGLRFVRVKAFLYVLLLTLFGVTFVVKLLERGESKAVAKYKLVSVNDPEIIKRLEGFIKEEEVHERLLIEGIDEKKVRYLGSITLGISDSLVELTGIYAGSLGAFSNNLVAGLTGLIAGLSASISMAIASYMQARSEGVKNPKTAAIFTFVAYIAVAVLLSIPYLTLPSLTIAFVVMLIIATTTTAYMTLYTSVINDRKFTREFIETAALIFGVSTLLYIVGIFVREFLGITVG